jgi:hypothetical protein
LQTQSYLRAIGLLLLSFGLLLIFFVTISNGQYLLLESESSLCFLVSGAIALVLSAYIKQVGEKESAFWSINSKISKRARVIIGAILLLFAFVFFAPIIYNANLLPCYAYTLCLSNSAGLESLGYLLFGFGTAYSFELGYPLLFAFAPLPIVISGLVVISPELQNGSIRNLVLKIESNGRNAWLGVGIFLILLGIGWAIGSVTSEQVSGSYLVYNDFSKLLALAFVFAAAYSFYKAGKSSVSNLISKKEREITARN